MNDGNKPIIDWQAIIERGFDEDLIKEFMPTCIDENIKILESLRSAVKKADAEETASYAHSIKGAVANVGAVRLSDAALNLEQAAINEDLSKAEELLNSIIDEFDELKSFVSKDDWIQKAQKQSPDVVETGQSLKS